MPESCPACRRRRVHVESNVFKVSACVVTTFCQGFDVRKLFNSWITKYNHFFLPFPFNSSISLSSLFHSFCFWFFASSSFYFFFSDLLPLFLEFILYVLLFFFLISSYHSYLIFVLFCPFCRRLYLASQSSFGKGMFPPVLKS